jgi:hypothetical protein
MITRNEASKEKAFSKLPEDFNNLIKEVVTGSFDFPVEAEGTKLKITGRIYPEELLLRFSLSNENQIKCHNFTGSIDHDTEAGDLVDRIQDIMEALTSMMGEYLSTVEEEIDFPLDWHEYQFNNRKVYLMYSTENDSIEEQAAALLGDDFKEEEMEDNEIIGKDFFKEAEERFKANLH